MASGAMQKFMGMVRAALQVERKGSDGIRSHVRREVVAPSGAVELFDLFCVCTITDGPYVLRYEKSAAGKLKFLKAIKGDAGKSANGISAGKREAGARTTSLPVEGFEKMSFPCPWCGSNQIVECDECRSLVCGGRIRGNTFHCRTSCDGTGELIPLPSITGKTSVSAPRQAPTPVNPARNALRSGVTRSLVKR